MRTFPTAPVFKRASGYFAEGCRYRLPYLLISPPEDGLIEQQNILIFIMYIQHSAHSICNRMFRKQHFHAQQKVEFEFYFGNSMNIIENLHCLKTQNILYMLILEKSSLFIVHILG